MSGFVTRTLFRLVPLWVCLCVVACGPSATIKVVEEKAEPQLNPEELKRLKEKEEEERRKAELAKSLQVRKVVVAEKPEFVPGVEIEAQKSFASGVVSVYQVPPDYGVAAEMFEKALTIDKNFLEAYFNLGMVFERVGKGEEALQVYQKALDANPTSGSAKAYIGKVYLAKAREALDSGEASKAAELKSKAKKLFDEVITNDPDNVEANNALALYWLMQAQEEQERASQLDAISTAEDFVQNVLTIQPANVVALNTRGLIYLLKGELQIAKWIFENKVLALDKFSTEAFNNLGLTYYKLGDTPRAVINFLKAIEVNPDNLSARLNLAAIFLNYLNYAAAREQYEYVLAIRPEHVEAIVGLGSCKVGMQEFEEGFELYRKAVSLDPEKLPLLLRIARIYQVKLIDFDKAIAVYEEYIAQATKRGLDVSDAQKGLEQTRKMAEQMKRMEEEMAKAEAEAKRLEEEMKAKAAELEKEMKKLESLTHDYAKQLEAFVKEKRANRKADPETIKKVKAAKALIAELAKVETPFKEAREYIGMTMVAEAEPIVKAAQDLYRTIEPKVIELLGIKKVQKIEEEGSGPPPTAERKGDSAPAGEAAPAPAPESASPAPTLVPGSAPAPGSEEAPAPAAEEAPAPTAEEAPAPAAEPALAPPPEQAPSPNDVIIPDVTPLPINN